MLPHIRITFSFSKYLWGQLGWHLINSVFTKALAKMYPEPPQLPWTWSELLHPKASFTTASILSDETLISQVFSTIMPLPISSRGITPSVWTSFGKTTPFLRIQGCASGEHRTLQMCFQRFDALY
jgi:hypothetical protein